MNQDDRHCNSCEQAWRGNSGEALHCPYCQRVIHGEPVRLEAFRHPGALLPDPAPRWRRTHGAARVWQAVEDADVRYYEALTPRQAEVLATLVAGAPTNKEIAERLVISHRTVNRHLADIYEKLGVSNRYEAIVWAVRHRCVPLTNGTLYPFVSLPSLPS